MAAGLNEALINARKSWAALGLLATPVNAGTLSEIGRLLNKVDSQQSALNKSAASLADAQAAVRRAKKLLEKINASTATRAAALQFSSSGRSNPAEELPGSPVS